MKELKALVLSLIITPIYIFLVGVFWSISNGERPLYFISLYFPSAPVKFQKDCDYILPENASIIQFNDSSYSVKQQDGIFSPKYPKFYKSTDTIWYQAISWIEEDVKYKDSCQAKFAFKMCLKRDSINKANKQFKVVQ